MNRNQVRFIKSIIVCCVVTLTAAGQTITVKGNVCSPYGPVMSALVIFAPADDTTRPFKALTDTLGNFRVDIVTTIGGDGYRPTKFQLERNYPNPFSSATAIPFTLNNQSNVTVRVYNILGQQVREFNEGFLSAGIHSIVWDGTNSSGRKVASGVYFCQLSDGKETQVGKMLFGGGESKTTLSNLDQIIKTKTSPRELAKLGSARFTVLVQSTDSTTPPIITKQFSNFTVQGDTTVNIVVDELNDFALCYSKGYKGYGQIFLNNMVGTHPRDISNYAGTDDYPQWSPQGRYIVYQRSVGLGGPLTCVYDMQNQTYTNLTSDGGLSASLPHWSTNGSVYFAYERQVLSPLGTYLMNPDGSGKKKMLDSVATNIYFYEDCYRFVYVMGWTKVYRTNVDGTVNEFICDIEQVLQQADVTQGFNPQTEELLLSYVSASDSVNWIAAYNINTKTLRNLYRAEAGYYFVRLQSSADCSQIAAVEHSDQDECLYVFAGITKKKVAIVPASTPYACFSYNDMQFSRDGRYLAFSEQHFDSGQWVSWTEPLYVVDVVTGARHLIDIGRTPSWNKLP